MNATRNRGELLILTLLLALSVGCSRNATETGQWVFETRESAAEELVDALERDDVDSFRGIFGPAYEAEIVTPAWADEHQIRQQIAVAAREKLEFVETDSGETEIVLGTESWPFPVLLVRHEGGWIFDTENGLEVVADRRIGSNELDAVAIMRAYVDAQIEYARTDHDDDDVLEYAQRLVSPAGSELGLYWKAGPEEAQSPFGPLVEGAARDPETLDPANPLRGYYFRILTRQGENPPGGRYDYVINGNMIAGFALVAYPGNYGKSGVMTFVVNHSGRVYEKDLGSFDGMDVYDPDDSWTLVSD